MFGALRLAEFPLPVLLSEVNPPPGWAQAVRDISCRYGVDHVLEGDNPTSRTVDDRPGPSKVRITVGSRVERESSWLSWTYRHDVLAIARWCMGPVNPVDDDSCVTINEAQPGFGYEWHVDSNAITGILFATNNDSGGQLVLRASDVELSVAPAIGRLVLFPGREIEHCVTEATDVRISCPMNFVRPGEERPAAMNEYLYPS